MRKTVTVLDIPFDSMTEEELIRLLRGYIQEARNHVVVTPNPEAVMQARRNPVFMEALLAADLRLPDGVGIVLASRIIKQPIPNRLRGVDTTYRLFEALSKGNGATAYFLGGAPGVPGMPGMPGVAEAAKIQMENRYPGLRVVGFHDGYFNPQEEILILEEIRRLSPDILLVGMGMPRQELWVHRNRDALKVRVTLCVGGTLDILSGRLKLTPAWLRRLGLEWLHRLLREPSRAVRMLDLPRFMLAVLRGIVRGKPGR